MKKLLTVLLLAASSMMLTGCNIDYSEGTRVGVVQKISKKGFLCKTYEGEMLMSAGTVALPEKFQFAVQDEVTLKKITQAIATRKTVELTYKQEIWRTPCHPDSQYTVTDVTYSTGTGATFDDDPATEVTTTN